MANRTQPFNARALEQMGVPPLNSGLDGRGIIIGFVDYGFDVLHPCLRDPETGRTRFSFLLDQNTGRELEAAAIDGLIAACERTGTREIADDAYDPHASYFLRRGAPGGAHGTLVTSITAGTPVAGFRGVAPAADLIGVQLGLLDHHWKEEDASGAPTWASWHPETQPLWNGWRSYDDARPIIDALDYIYERATRMWANGLVINLSIGAYAGAHDGRSAVEQKITELTHANAGLPCAVVLSAGNAGVEEGHFGGTAEPGRPLSFAWRMNRGDASQNKLEIWYRSGAPLDISISLPSESAQGVRLSPGRTHGIVLGGKRIGIADHVPNARPPLSRARVLVHPPYVPDHVWPQCTDELSIEFCCAAASERAQVHAWIERDDGLANRSTLYPSHPTSTLSNLAGADGAIVVAGYDHRRSIEGLGVYPLSSFGPLPWTETRTTPHICAPCHRIWGARSKTAGFMEMSGTSAAAALASGLLALLMQRLAPRRGFHPQQWAELLVLPALRSDWSPRFGFGPVNIAHVLEEAVA